MRSGMPSGVRTSTDRPKRSSSCGRSSPSSGLPLPTSTKRAGWRTLRPSRSTTFSPDAATSIRRSTRWSSSRLTSSIYRKPRLAWASRPGSNAFSPRVRARSRSSAPTTRSSVAPSGRSTTGTGTASGRMVGAGAALVAPGAGPGGIAVVAAARDRLHRRQQGGEGADGGGLAGAAVPEHQHAADAGVGGGDQQGQLHLVLADDGGKRKGVAWWGCGRRRGHVHAADDNRSGHGRHPARPEPNWFR